MRYVDPTGFAPEDERQGFDFPPDPVTAFRQDAEAAGRGFLQGAGEAARDAAVGTATTATRLVSTMTPPHQRFPVEMQQGPLKPFGREDLDALKGDVKFTVDTLRNISETGPAALDAMAELGPEASGRVLGGTTVNTIATVEGGRALVRGGVGALRSAPAELGEVGENLGGMFRGRSGPAAEILLERGATGPSIPIGTRLADGRIAGDGPGAALNAERQGAVLEIPRPARLRNPDISAAERALLEKELRVKVRPLQRAAREGRLEYRPGTMETRIAELQAEYRAAVAARYERRFGVEPDMRLLDADHPLDLVVRGSPTQPLKMLHRSINRSVGSSLKQAAERIKLQPGDVISDIVVK